MHSLGIIWIGDFVTVDNRWAVSAHLLLSQHSNKAGIRFYTDTSKTLKIYNIYKGKS